MIDQTAERRRLLLGAAPPASAVASGAQILVVSGGRAGVGTTTMAVNLAAVLASEALRVVLIDADLYQADIAARCGMATQPNIGDVFSGRRTIHEALQRGPAGMQILAGSASPDTTAAVTTRILQRLRRQLLSLQRHADWIIIDAGHEATELSSQLWSVANQVLLVTAPDAAAVMDTYALIKTLLSRQSPVRPLSLVVNPAAAAADAADVFRRIDQSCRRFLGISLELAGFVPPDRSTATGQATTTENPSPPAGPFIEAINRLARHIAAAPHQEASSRRMAA